MAAERPLRVLLLQGPVGPFFRRLQDALESRGAEVTRVLFNTGDVLFGPGGDAVRFTGSIDQWRDWLEGRFEKSSFDLVILFGAKRPAHRIAREVAEKSGVPLLSLEEGYLRAGYVTCEENGNNDLSPVCGRFPDAPDETEAAPGAKLGSSFRIMSFWGFLYYTTRILFTPRSDEPLIHRPLRGPFIEAGFWLRNIWRLVSSRVTERRLVSSLLRKHDRDYLLIPLQMPSDSQMGAAARGWNIERLVDATISRFAKTRSVAKLVFKLHPLDGHARTREKRIREIAAAHGVAADVVVIHSGSIATLSIHSAGMIVINSTSGMTAIHHGTPLLVMGEAVFRHERLVHCGNDEDDIERFMLSREAASLETRRDYERFLARESLAPGDFYHLRGMRIAASYIAEKAIEKARAADRVEDGGNVSAGALSPSA